MTDTDSPGGTYTLIVAVPEPLEICVGALGEITFSSGEYAYTGSALGSGGFTRVDRHYRVAAGEHDVTHWHIDYLLGDSQTELTGVVGRETAAVECLVAQQLPESTAGDFGASDCSCQSHLAYTNSDDMETTVTDIYSQLDEGRFLPRLSNNRD